MKVYLPVLFSLMAFFFLFIGIKVVLNKRPLFMPSRYFFYFMILAFSPQFVHTAYMLTRKLPGGLGVVIYLSPIMFFCIFILFWIQMKGYIAIGITDESFRDALHFSLNKNNLPFEEQLSVVKLPSINASLQVAIQSWMGTGQLKLKKTQDSKVLPEIVKGLNEYYLENNIKPNNITSIFYIIIGVFMLAFAVAFCFVHP